MNNSPTSPSRSSTSTSREAKVMEIAIRMARADPIHFLRLALTARTSRRDPMPAVHREMQQHLTKHRLALIELPRDHGKTTQVCWRILWELGRNPNLRVRIVCASEAIARDRSRFLRLNIESNPIVASVFPHLKRGDLWTATGFSVQRSPGIIGPSVTAFGIGAASTGTRADLLVCDDVVDVKAIYSKAQRERTADDFLNNLLNLMEPSGRFWGLSTPWHADDLNARLKRNPAYSLFRRPVTSEFQPVWHEHWPEQSLKERASEIGSAAFARGYRLTPLAEEELVIRKEWVQTWSELPSEFERVILSVDPAVSVKASADATAMVVLAKAGNRVYCLAADAKRVTAPALVQWLESLDTTWRPHEIVFESNGAFDAVRELLVKHASFGPKVVGVKQSKSKLARFAAFAVMVQNGAFRLCADGSQQTLFNEMTQFPFAEHDDLLDAAATGMNHLHALRCEPRIWDFAA